MTYEEYLNEVNARFIERRGTPFILSAKDVMLMKEWWDEGVPLPLVVEAIDSVFEKNETSGRRKAISSLRYCRHAVKELWQERKAMLVGSAEAPPESSPEALLESLAAQLEAIEVAAPFAPRVRALAGERSVPRIEEKLIEVEGEMLDAVAATAPAAMEEIRAEIAPSLSGLDDKTRARTEQANLRRLLRERFGLPRLTLFS